MSDNNPQRVHIDIAPELTPLQQRVARAVSHLRKSVDSVNVEQETTNLPEALRKFTPLAEEQSIIHASTGLHELELAVARAPDSEEAVAASGPSDPR